MTSENILLREINNLLDVDLFLQTTVPFKTNT